MVRAESVESCHSHTMDKVIDNLFYFAGLLKGFPPTISPSLEDYEFIQCAERPLPHAIDSLRILINVIHFQPHEVDIHVLRKEILEIRTAHDMRQNRDGLWMTNNCVYTYELPPEVQGKEIHAEWFDDDYLSITTTSANREEDSEKVKIIPKRVQKSLRPEIDLIVLKEMADDIVDRSLDASKSINFQTHKFPPEVSKAIKGGNITRQQTNEMSSAYCSNVEQTSPTDGSSSEEVQTSSFEKISN